jgi:hypothetical protein
MFGLIITVIGLIIDGANAAGNALKDTGVGIVRLDPLVYGLGLFVSLALKAVGAWLLFMKGFLELDKD